LTDLAIHKQFSPTAPHEIFRRCVALGWTCAVFRLPGQNQSITMLQQHLPATPDIASLDVTEKDGFLFAPFTPSNKYPVLFLEPDFVYTDDNIPNGLNVLLENTHNSRFKNGFTTSKKVVATTKDAYIDLVCKIKDGIEQSPLKKSIASRIKIVRRNPSFEPLSYYQKLTKSYPTAFCFLFYSPLTGMWTGASPEKLLSVENSKLQTMALAGTLVDTSSSTAEWTEKEANEQQLVSDFIQQKLEAWSTAPLAAKGPYTVSTGKVLHLRTDFELTIKQNRALGPLLQSLHPTPAIGGFPQKMALDFIQEHEEHHRAYYCGFLGPFGKDKQTDVFVNLRSMQIFPDKLALYIGGGITEGSVPEDEWVETENKAKTLLDLL